MGRLGQDPELRYTQTQMPVTTLNVATSEYKMGKDGQRQEMTEWHRIVVWGKQAENCNKYLKKGRAVFVEGKIQTRSWDDSSGQKRYATEIVATNVQFMPSGASGQQTYSAQGEHDSSFGSGDPFSSNQASFSGGQSNMSTNFPKAESSETSYVQSSPGLEDIPF